MRQIVRRGSIGDAPAGDPLRASDEPGDTITFTAASTVFDIQNSTGQLTLRPWSGASPLNYEGTQTYLVPVTATDQTGLATTAEVEILAENFEAIAERGCQVTVIPGPENQLLVLLYAQTQLISLTTKGC